MADEVPASERGTTPIERGNTTRPVRNPSSTLPAGGANAPVASKQALGTGSSLPSTLTVDLPIPGVIFLLSIEGHIRAGKSRDNAIELSKLAHAYARGLVNRLRRVIAFEIAEFGTLTEMLSKVPVRHHGKKWGNLMIVTHGPGERYPELTGGVFLGDQEYFVGGSFNDILDFSNTATGQRLIQKFRANVDSQASLQLIACGVASHGPDVPIALRQMLGIEGVVVTPRVDVDFDLQTGELGTYFDSADDRAGIELSDQRRRRIRALQDREWLILPAITLTDLPAPMPSQLVR